MKESSASTDAASMMTSPATVKASIPFIRLSAMVTNPPNKIRSAVSTESLSKIFACCDECHVEVE